MAIRVMMHVLGEEPFEAELPFEPDPTSAFVLLKNPLTPDHQRQAKWVTHGTKSYYFSWARISFIEVIGDTDQEEIMEPYPKRQQH